MAAGWTSAEDFEKDIWEFSENNTYQEYQRAPPSTIVEYNNRMLANRTNSIFAHPPSSPEEDEDVTYFVSGRGRGVGNRLVKPGYHHPTENYQTEEDIRRKIRQVSGIGYSNEFIEQVYKSNLKSEVEGSDVVANELKLRPISSCSSSSNSGDSLPRKNQKNAPSVESPRKVVEKDKVNEKPLPLSEMLKRTSVKDVDRKYNLPTLKNNVYSSNDVETSYADAPEKYVRRKKKALDINCKEAFPPL